MDTCACIAYTTAAWGQREVPAERSESTRAAVEAGATRVTALEHSTATALAVRPRESYATNNNKKKIKKITERKGERQREREKWREALHILTKQKRQAGMRMGGMCAGKEGHCALLPRVGCPPHPRSDWNGLWSEVTPSQTHTQTYIRRVTVTIPTSEVWGNFSGSSPTPLSLSDLPPQRTFKANAQGDEPLLS